MKNIANLKSHICSGCSKLGTVKSTTELFVKICNSCDKKNSLLEDFKEMNYFEIFSISPSYDIEKNFSKLDKEYRSILKLVHPDLLSFLNDKNTLKEAEEVSSHINKSYTALKCGYERAVYLVSFKIIVKIKRNYY